MPKLSAFIITAIGLICFSISAQAGMNPFKKTKNFTFGNEISWDHKEDAATKSGSVRDGSNTNYYHLNVTKDRLRLRLGKNDPSGELEGTRNLRKMVIVDVLVDGNRFNVFGRCLNEQQRPGKKFKAGAVVPGGECVNTGDGDFTMRIGDADRELLKTAQTVEFIIVPFNRPVKISYSMTGFSAIMSEIDKPAPIVIKQAAPKIAAKAKPMIKPAPKKTVKYCYAKPPVDFSSVVRAMKYRCNNEAGKAVVERKIAAKVAKERQKMQDEMAQFRQEEETKVLASANRQREIEWAKKQRVMWVKRCTKHWNKGVSPCYCEKYMDQAPEGVENTCGR